MIDAVGRPNAAWTALHRNEQDARAKFHDAVATNSVGAAERRQLARQWWLSVEALLRFYARAMAQGRHFDLHPTPEALLWTLGGLAGHLGVGHLPGPVTDVVGRGTAAIGPAERLHIGWATGYLRLASIGEIADTTPVKTVMENYGVRRQTVQRWAKLALPEDVVSALENPDAVAFHMKNAGAIYREHGRSSLAIEFRGRGGKGAN